MTLISPGSPGHPSQDRLSLQVDATGWTDAVEDRRDSVTGNEKQGPKTPGNVTGHWQKLVRMQKEKRNLRVRTTSGPERTETL